MSTLYTLLEQARAARIKLEQEQSQQTALYGGCKELLAARLERRIAAYQETGDEQGLADFLARFEQKAREA